MNQLRSGHCRTTYTLHQWGRERHRPATTAASNHRQLSSCCTSVRSYSSLAAWHSYINYKTKKPLNGYLAGARHTKSKVSNVITAYTELTAMRTSTTVRRRFITATTTAVAPLYAGFLSSTSAPWSTRNSTILALPIRAASASGELPPGPTLFTSAPTMFTVQLSLSK